MAVLNFDVLKLAWKKLVTENAGEIQKLVPYLSDPQEIYLKRVSETETMIAVQFLGFQNAVENSEGIPQVKRFITENWLKKFSMNVQIMRSDPSSLIVQLSKELKFTESKLPSPKEEKLNTPVLREHKYKQMPKRGDLTNLIRLVRVEENE